MAKKIKVRFNLGKGKNYMKWKLEFPTHSEYYSPEDYNLALFGCQLKNHKKTAEKITRVPTNPYAPGFFVTVSS